MSGDSNLTVDIVRPHLKNTLHSNGHTYVDFEEGSTSLITCNQSDNEVYILKPHDIETGEPKCQSFGDDSTMNVSFLKVADEMAFVGLNNSTVQIYSYPQFEKEGLLVRFESTPLCVDLNHDKSFAAIGTADGTVRTVELSSPHRFKTFEGHLGPILSVCYDPSEDYLVTSSCDGSVKVWKCGDRKCVKTWECVPKSNDVENSKVMAQCCWQPSYGTHLAVPGDKCVKFYDRRHQNFLESPKFTFTHYLIPDYVSMVCWHGKEVESSSSGKDENNLIAFVMESTNVLLAEFASNQCKVLRCIQGKQSKVTSFLWMPNSVDFVVGDEIGMVYLYTNCVPVKSKRFAAAEEAKNSQNVANQTVKGADDILNEMVKTHKEASGGDGNLNAADDDGDDGSISLDQIKHSYTLNMERGLEGEDADAAVAGSDGQPGGSQGNNYNFYGSGGPSNNQQAVVAAPKVEIISYQAPFQPSCSPVSLGTRYMKWNLIGIVRREEHSPTEDEAEDENIGASITVEFHDSTFHHAMHLNDDHGYTLADLSEEALLLASPSSIVNESKASVITCNTFSFWDHSNQWSTELPPGEKAVALCLGSQSWLAVATSFGLLRIFSVSGLQLSVIMLPGHLVSISGGMDELLHVYQPSQTLQRDRFYSAAVYKVTGFEVNLAMSEQFPMCDADDSVIWTGFSQEGDAVVAFASGPMYMLKRSSSHNLGHCWLPVFNFKQFLNSKSDRIWTVGVTGKQLRAIYCKASKFPAQLPRPIVLTYNLGLPLCNIESEQSQMELELQNQRVFKALSTQEVQSAFLKMFALACRTDRDCRAVDICSLMPNEETVILAIKYATKLKKLTLAQKLSAIAHEKSTMRVGLDYSQQQQNFSGFEDENSRSLFGSQSAESADAVQAADSGANLLSETDNPILRRANSGKMFRNVTMQDETTASDGSLLSPSASTMEVSDSTSKRRKNPFVHEKTSSTLQLSTSASTLELSRSPSVGSSVFDNLKLLKPEKLKVGSDTAAKSLSRRKSVSSTAARNKVENGASEQENKAPTMTASNSESAAVVQKKMTPFQIYFEKIKPDLKEEFPEKSDEELLPVAMRRWKQLSADEKASESLVDSGGGGSGVSLKRKSVCDIDGISGDSSSNTDSAGGGCIVTKKKKFDRAILDQFSFN